QNLSCSSIRPENRRAVLSFYSIPSAHCSLEPVDAAMDQGCEHGYVYFASRRTLLSYIFVVSFIIIRP
ncbi:MAG: hypothetical protein KDA91_23530, partial [Planctomycetaceae bacterium]|nr:hypothetical protein [Planctomycetaceae bacterium]